MTKLSLLLAGASIAFAGFATAEAQIDPAVAAAMKARQAHMSLFAFNLGTLGGMAQDKIPYDAAAAMTAASNLAALAAVDQAGYWVEGSDTTVEGSRALPAIWDDMDGFVADQADLLAAAQGLDAAAGDGLDALKAAFGPVGGACGACHRAYRQSDE